MKTLKNIVTALFFVVALSSVKGQCPKMVTAQDFDAYVTLLDEYRSGLKEARQHARKSNRGDIEIATNKLEYWSKDIKRYILSYRETHTDKVCERLFVTDATYFKDFVMLGLFFKNNPAIAPIKFSNYEK